MSKQAVSMPAQSQEVGKFNKPSHRRSSGESPSMLLNRNLIILFAAQSLALSCAPAAVLMGGLVGALLAPSSAWITFPVAASIIGTAAATVPAALLMRRFGRRAGFIGSALLGCIAALIAAAAIFIASFWLFSLGLFLIGVTITFVLQYRFAAAESVPVDQAGPAISSLMFSGIIAAWLGPEIAQHGAEIFGLPAYTGSFIGIALLLALATLVLLGFKNTEMETVSHAAETAPLKQLFTPPLALAILGGITAFSVMSLVMTATPVELHHGRGHSLDKTSWVIQSHIIAMYLPSLISGKLITRFGARTVMSLGLLIFAISVAIALSGVTYQHFWVALVALGIAWNFLFIGSTTLLTENAPAEARFRIQAVNEFAVFGTQALAALGSGWIVSELGWYALQWLAVPFLVTTAVMLLYQRLFQVPVTPR